MWIIIDTIHTAYFYGPQEHFLYNEFFVVQKAHVYLNKNMGPTMRFVSAFPLWTPKLMFAVLWSQPRYKSQRVRLAPLGKNQVQNLRQGVKELKRSTKYRKVQKESQVRENYEKEIKEKR